jgi:multidrug efflux pump subunit AcrB
VVPRHQAIHIRGVVLVALAALVGILSLASGAGGGSEMRERRGDVLVD